LNQSGIETLYTWPHSGTPVRGLNWTKVELRLPVLIDRDSHRDNDVWIEPKWNWDDFYKCFSCHCFFPFELNQSGIETPSLLSKERTCRSGQFELNQSGIETLSILRHLHLPLACLNWTKVELRRTMIGLLLQGSPCLFELNQSGIETFIWFCIIFLFHFFSVWIEPKWNWDPLKEEDFI